MRLMHCEINVLIMLILRVFSDKTYYHLKTRFPLTSQTARTYFINIEKGNMINTNFLICHIKC